MKGENLLQAMGGIDEAILKKNSNASRRGPAWAWIPAVAACLALILGISAFLQPAAPYLGPSVKLLDPANSFENIGLRYEGAEPQDSGKGSVVSPQFHFHERPVVLARAVEVLPDVYEDMPSYGLERIFRWRIFKLEIIDSLDSGISGFLWFGIPEAYYQDLTAWDSLLLSLYLEGVDLTLKNTADQTLLTLERFYADPIPYHGDTVAFTDGVFDDSLWSDGYWAEPPYFYFSAYRDLDREGNSLIVRRGSTLEDALAIIAQRRTDPKYDPADGVQAPLPAQVLAVMEQLEDAYVGTGFDWGPEYKERYIRYTRYVGGCPTNDILLIHSQTGEILRSENTLTPSDLKNLPDLGAFIAELELDALPLAADDIRGQQLYRMAYGWYEKTENGVLAFVKVVWYHESTDRSRAYVLYDDLYLELSLEGAAVRSRQEMRQLLGPGNENLDHFNDREGTIYLLWK